MGKAMEGVPAWSAASHRPGWPRSMSTPSTTWRSCCWGTRWEARLSSPGSQGRAGEGAGANHGPAVTKTLCLGQVDSAHERVVKREDGEKLAKVSQGRGVVRGCPWRPRAWAVPARPPPGWQQLFTGVWAALHGDQRQDGPQRGLGLHSHSKVSPASHQGSPSTGPKPSYWSPGHCVPLSPPLHRELKQRSMKTPSEPRFRLHDYVKREGRGASCCRP